MAPGQQIGCNEEHREDPVNDSIRDRLAGLVDQNQLNKGQRDLVDDRYFPEVGIRRGQMPSKANTAANMVKLTIRQA